MFEATQVRRTHSLAEERENEKVHPEGAWSQLLALVPRAVEIFCVDTSSDNVHSHYSFAAVNISLVSNTEEFP